MISKADLKVNVHYMGAKIGDGFALIGYVDVVNNNILVYHSNLTQRSMDEVQGMTAEQIQDLAQQEANDILDSPEAQKVQQDYIDLVNLGLYN